MRIEIRTTPEEKRHWQEIAENKGVTLSELVRSSLSGLRLRKPRPRSTVDPALIRELARIGNNLNQLAHAANRRKPLDSTALLRRRGRSHRPRNQRCAPVRVHVQQQAGHLS